MWSRPINSNRAAGFSPGFWRGLALRGLLGISDPIQTLTTALSEESYWIFASCEYNRSTISVKSNISWISYRCALRTHFVVRKEWELFTLQRWREVTEELRAKVPVLMLFTIEDHDTSFYCVRVQQKLTETISIPQVFTALRYAGTSDQCEDRAMSSMTDISSKLCSMCSL